MTATGGPDYQHILEVALTVLPVAVGFIWAIKSDTKVLRTRVDTIDKKLDAIEDVRVKFAEGNGRMDRLYDSIKRTDDMALGTGRRLDELTERVNRFIDTREEAGQH